MSFLGGILKSVINPATLMQLAMGPAGWASLALKTIGTAIMQQVIQQVGQQLGLPPAVISMAQQAFSAASGQPFNPQSVAGAVEQFGQMMGANPAEIGDAQRGANDVVKQLVDSVLKQARDGGGEDGPSTGESRLVKLAKAMGKLLDKKMDKIIEVGEKMDGAKKQGSLSAEMQALSQEMSMISNALNNMIKSIGEANTTLARKS
jgi:hypothetical protein